MTPALSDVVAEPWTKRRRRTAELRDRYDFAREVLDFYATLLSVQEGAFDDARAALPPAASLVPYVSEVVVPRVAEASIAAGPEKLRDEVLRCLKRNSASDIVARWIRSEDQPPAERYLARASVGPVLEACPELRVACAGPRDMRHCPECGGPPQLSYSAPAPEDLATGRRFLGCGRCGASWGYARMTCAGCGEDSSGNLPIFSEEGTASGERGSIVRGLQGPSTDGHAPAIFVHMRVEACESCHHYLIGIDTTSDPHAVPAVDELAAIPLDLYARERGFTKITPNLMGF